MLPTFLVLLVAMFATRSLPFLRPVVSFSITTRMVQRYRVHQPTWALFSSSIKKRPRKRQAKNNGKQQLQTDYISRPIIQWYPGHIAKAERSLHETLKAVDVVVEVRDARAVLATTHPSVDTWSAGTPRIVALTHGDCIAAEARSIWEKEWGTTILPTEEGIMKPDGKTRNQAHQAQAEREKYQSEENDTHDNNATAITSTSSSQQHSPLLFINAQTGTGVPALIKAIATAGAHVHVRREQQGLRKRPLRVGILGFPNVGKSSLINRLIGRKRTKTANTPGVTRSLQWIRVNGGSSNTDFELLDSPGIIPANLVDQTNAALLAACNCVGQAGYDPVTVATALAEWLLQVHRTEQDVVQLMTPEWRRRCQERYKFDPLVVDEHQLSGEDFLFRVADETCRGSPHDAATKILQDFRTGRWGKICLQLPPSILQQPEDLSTRHSDSEERAKAQERMAELQAQHEAIMEKVDAMGLELPKEETEVGKGQFEGW